MTSQHHAGAPDQTLRPSPTSVYEQVQTATQANGAQDNQARHCPHCGAPLEATATFCAFCKSPVALPSASDAPSFPKRASLTNEERKQLETSKDTRNRRRPSFFDDFISFCFFVSAPPVFFTIFSLITEEPTLDSLVSLIFSLLTLMPLFILSSMELYRNHQIERSLKKATSRVDCPVLDMWKDDDSESTSYFIAWELTATDQYGQPLRLQQAQKIYDDKLYDCPKMRETVQVRYAPEQPDISILDEERVAAIQKSSHV
ncbi:MAG: zinc ribbon domain-containing protein [Roseiflexus sp.]|nr:zinc ribbon domain-containing protein [Roseiflexus sp.]